MIFSEEAVEYLLAVALVVAFLAVLALIVVEVRRRRAGQLVFPRGRFVLRMSIGLLLETLLAAVFIGSIVLRLHDPAGRPLTFLCYWFGCILAAALLVILTMQEFKQLSHIKNERENEIWGDVARIMANSMKKKDLHQ